MSKLLLFDLDGTLLRTDKTISDRTIQAIEECRKKGYFIGISTARSEGNAEKFLMDVKPELMIASGGALVRFLGKVIYEAGFSRKETRMIIDTAFHIGGAEREITVDTLGAHYWNYKVSPKQQDSSWGETIYTDYRDFEDTALKICVELPEKIYAEKIAAVVADCDWVKFSDGDWYKFSKTQATKEHALFNIADILEIALCDITAFGDDYADIGMLKMCGKGIAMGNAIREVKDIADHVIGSNDEDGIAAWLEQNILNQMFIRKAEIRDLEELLDIYNYEVANGISTLDLHSKSLEDWKKWFEAHNTGNHSLLVAEKDHQIAGYASLSTYREKEAFQSTVELSVYVEVSFRNRGVATKLMQSIIDLARQDENTHMIVSVITAGNQASKRLHEKFGFTYCGSLHEVGYKMGAYRSVDHYELKV